MKLKTRTKINHEQWLVHRTHLFSQFFALSSEYFPAIGHQEIKVTNRDQGCITTGCSICSRMQATENKWKQTYHLH